MACIYVSRFAAFNFIQFKWASCFLFLLIGWHISASAQNVEALTRKLEKIKGDRLEDTLIIMSLYDLSGMMQNVNPDKSLDHIAMAYAASKKINYKKGIAIGQYRRAQILSNRGDFDLAKTLYDSALHLSTQEHFIDLKAKTLLEIGIIYGTRNNMATALDYFYRSLKITEEIKDEFHTGLNHQNIGNVYNALGSYEKAIEQYEIAANYFQKFDDSAEVAITKAQIAQVLIRLKKYDVAMQRLHESITSSKKVGYKDHRAFIYNLLAVAYLETQQLDSALHYANQSLQIAKELGMKDFEGNNYGILSSIYFQQPGNHLALAKQYMDSALLINKFTGNLELLEGNYKTLINIYHREGNYRLKSETQTLLQNVRDSIYATNNKQTIKNLEDQKAIDQKDHQIRLNELTIANSKRLQLIYALGALLLLVVGSVIYFQSRRQRKLNKALGTLNAQLAIHLDELAQSNKQLEDANTVKAKLFGIITHDLRSPVSSLKSFIELNKIAPGLLNDEEQAQHEQQLSKGVENLLHSMEEILLWSKSQMQLFKPQNEKVNVQEIFHEVAQAMPLEWVQKLEFTTHESAEVRTDKNMLKTILRNLTLNALKVVKDKNDGRVIWQLKAEHNQAYALSIQDNGCGMTQEEVQHYFNEGSVNSAKNGLGMYLIKDLSQLLQHELQITSQPKQGTTVTIILPKA